MNGLYIFLAMFFEPARGFRMIIKNRERFRWYVPVVLYGLIIAVRLSCIFITHYPLADPHPEDANLLTEFITLMLPMLSLVLSCYLVTTISDGETKLREILVGFGYAMAPYIVLSVFWSLLSHILSLTDIDLYSTLQTLMWVWVGVLVLIGISVMNTYTLRQTIKTVLISLFTCVFLWVVIFLIIILGQRLLEFIQTVISEYRIHIFN